MYDIKYYLPGAILILLAIIVLAVPEILVAFIAAAILIAGIGALYIGHKVRKSEIALGEFDQQFVDDDLYGGRFVRNPGFKRWFREF